MNGSDQWDGTSPTVIDGTNKGPLKSITEAILKMRKLRSNKPTSDNYATISILPGIYYQTSTIKLDRRDSFLTIQSFNNEPVTISGGKLLENGWKSFHCVPVCYKNK